MIYVNNPTLNHKSALLGTSESDQSVPLLVSTHAGPKEKVGLIIGESVSVEHRDPSLPFAITFCYRKRIV